MLQLKYSEFNLECGTDEAGRGCLAGPVTAAAVILPDDFRNELLNDSKQLKATDRRELRSVIETEAIDFGVAHVWPETIDKINILNASILAMHQAIDKLKELEFISVDGNRFKIYKELPYKTIIKGDGKFLNIAAASILAKTYRDDYMAQIHDHFPHYNWKKNKGYPTAEHREAIKRFGACIHHRHSFKLLPEQLKLDL